MKSFSILFVHMHEGTCALSRQIHEVATFWVREARSLCNYSVNSFQIFGCQKLVMKVVMNI